MATSDFALFEKIQQQYTQSKQENKSSCSHSDTVVTNETMNCLECGEVLEKSIMHEKEWRFYGFSDTRRTSDPNRVQPRKTEERTINKDVENMGFSDTIVGKANEIYTQVARGQIFRGESRKAVVFACVYHAYKMTTRYQTPNALMKTFGLNKKSGLRGLKIVNINAPKTSPIHQTTLTAVHHIYDIMGKFNAKQQQIDEVVDLYHQTKNRSSKLNRSRPQSMAAALIYHWICENQLGISLKKFAEKAELSELTITKNAKEIDMILERRARAKELDSGTES